MISLWYSIKRLVKSIKKIKQSSWIGLQLMTESRSRQNRIWWTQIMLWNFTTRCIVKILIWKNHSFPTTTSQVFNKNRSEMIYVRGFSLALGLAASRFFVNTKENGKTMQWRGWLKKPECLEMMQSFGGWSKPSGTFIFLPQSISRDLILMLNLQMQFIKLIFFSFLMTKRPQGCRKSTSTHWQ